MVIVCYDGAVTFICDRVDSSKNDNFFFPFLRFESRQGLRGRAGVKEIRAACLLQVSSTFHSFIEINMDPYKIRKSLSLK